MPITGLPKVLEVNINNMLDLAKVSSWNVHGEKERVQITIRFNIMDNTAEQMDTSNVTYRKVPPSQVRRDRDRAMQRSSYKENENIVSFDFNQKIDCENKKTKESTSSISPLPLQDQVDGIADDISPSPCHDHSSGEPSSNVESSSGSTCDTVGPTSADQYDNSIVDIYSAVNTYKMKAECGTCKSEIKTDDMIQCCYVCQLMFCSSCLHKFCHKEHQRYLAQYKSLSEYMAKQE